MSVPKDRSHMLGKKYGRWEVLKILPPAGGKVRAQCRCDCGTVKSVQVVSLENARSRSCGCQIKDHSTVMGKWFPGAEARRADYAAGIRR
jgi:hypothetical protein